MNEFLKSYFANAFEELTAAKNLLVNDFYRGVLNHCYYSCLGVIKGFLAEKGIYTTSPIKALEYFHQFYVNTNHISSNIFGIAEQLLNEHQSVQYDITGNFTSDEALKIIESTESFINYMLTKISQAERNN
jgi:uncharacterized protein (UPF0332 family)